MSSETSALTASFASTLSADIPLRLAAIADEPALEASPASFDVGQELGE
jgi:hypothetical protein